MAFQDAHMSYDLQFFTPRPGVDVHDIVEVDEDRDARGPRDPKTEARKGKLADALLAHDKRLERSKQDFDAIATLHKMRVDEAYERFRDIELTDTASGVQILLFDDGAGLSIPYWHSGDAARRVLEQAWSMIEIICRETGYEVFDPQLDRVIDVNAFDDVLATYAGATARMEAMVGRAAKKPWWKFW
jgi:hypothetical protein